jgi:hypothetical protein
MFLSDAGGVGLNLQQAANVCVNLELPWNPAVLEQRIGRIYRLGQSQPVDVYNLVTEEGIEARIAQLVAQKGALFRSVFDGTSDEVRFDGQGSFLTNVQKLVDLPALPTASVPTGDDADDAALLAGDSTEADGTGTQLPESAPLAEAPPTAAPADPLQGLKVTQLADGGLRIEAPPALAQPLADLLAALAASLGASGSNAP